MPPLLQETELQNDADRLAEESINLRSEVHKLQSSSTEFQAMFNELAQQVHDTEQAHEKRLRDTREELVAAKKQIRDTAAWGPGIPARLPGLSSLTTKQDDILQEEFAEFSLESVRNLSQTDLLIEFSNLVSDCFETFAGEWFVLCTSGLKLDWFLNVEAMGVLWVGS